MYAIHLISELWNNQFKWKISFYKNGYVSYKIISFSFLFYGSIFLGRVWEKTNNNVYDEIIRSTYIWNKIIILLSIGNIIISITLFEYDKRNVKKMF